MKRILATITVCFLLTGCQQQTPPPPQPYKPPALDEAEAEKVIDRLITMGYLKFVPEPWHAAVREQLIASATKRYLDSEWDENCVAIDQRSYPANAEDLVGRGAGECIQLLKPALVREGVKLEAVEDCCDDECVLLVINGKLHLIYDAETDSKVDPGTVVLKRLLEIVNGLLARAGSSERLYAIYSGKDGGVMLLTPEMHEYIQSLGDVFDHRWMPRGPQELSPQDRPVHR